MKQKIGESPIIIIIIIIITTANFNIALKFQFLKEDNHITRFSCCVRAFARLISTFERTDQSIYIYMNFTLLIASSASYS
jgi:hypothetical protein